MIGDDDCAVGASTNTFCTSSSLYLSSFIFSSFLLLSKETAVVRYGLVVESEGEDFDDDNKTDDGDGLVAIDCILKNDTLLVECVDEDNNDGDIFIFLLFDITFFVYN